MPGGSYLSVIKFAYLQVLDFLINLLSYTALAIARGVAPWDEAHYDPLNLIGRTPYDDNRCFYPCTLTSFFEDAYGISIYLCRYLPGIYLSLEPTRVDDSTQCDHCSVNFYRRHLEGTLLCRPYICRAILATRNIS